jgi:hypothetical protein
MENNIFMFFDQKKIDMDLIAKEKLDFFVID